MSTVLVSISRLEHLKEYSRYNNNYYKIPKEIQNEFPVDNSLNIILEICDEEYDSYKYIFGNENEGIENIKDDGKHEFYNSLERSNFCLDYICFDPKDKNKQYY